MKFIRVFTVVSEFVIALGMLAFENALVKCIEWGVVSQNYCLEAMQKLDSLRYFVASNVSREAKRKLVGSRRSNPIKKSDVLQS